MLIPSAFGIIILVVMLIIRMVVLEKEKKKLLTKNKLLCRENHKLRLKLQENENSTKG